MLFRCVCSYLPMRVGKVSYKGNIESGEECNKRLLCQIECKRLGKIGGQNLGTIPGLGTGSTVVADVSE